jgi:protocatechuate 3,4-dioxygenase beta subunit
VTYTDAAMTDECGNTGSFVRTWKAVDACLNEATSTQTITIADTTPPTLVGVPGDVTVNCDAVPTPPVVTATDNCGPNPTVSYAQVQLPGATVDGYQLQRTWSATDACGNGVTNSQVITVQGCSAAIGNLVWEDLNNNGRVDAGESGLSNVVVQLWRDFDMNGIYEPTKGDTQVAQTVTTVGGSYNFTNLAPGAYFVVIPTPPTNHTLCSTHNTVLDNQVDDDNNGFQPGSAGTVTFSPAIQLSAGETDNTVDFGFTDPGIGNLVWADLNHNGLVDTNEPGVPGVVVVLYGTNASNGTNYVALLETTTDTNGYYLFQALAPNSYYVKVPATNFAAGGALEHYWLTSPSVTTDDQVDDDNNGSQAEFGGDVVSALIELSGGQEPVDSVKEIGRGKELDNGADEDADMTVDFGFVPTSNSLGTIGDRAWLDFNANGVQDANEPGLPNVTVRLYQIAVGGNRLLASTNTAANGAYLFTNLPPANYFVEFTRPPGYTNSPTSGTNNPALDSDSDPVTGRTVTFALGLNATNLTWDAGFISLNPTAALVGWLGAWADHGAVWVTWQTYSEPGLLGFDVWRATGEEAETLVSLSPVDADGRAIGHRYTIPDISAQLPGRYTYRLVGYYDDGTMPTLERVTVSLAADATANTVRLLALEAAPDGLRVRWTGGMPPYVLEYSDSLSIGAVWQAVGPAQAGETEATVPATGEAGFFRAKGSVK